MSAGFQPGFQPAFQHAGFSPHTHVSAKQTLGSTTLHNASAFNNLYLRMDKTELAQVQSEIERFMSYDRFVQIQTRLVQLRTEEEEKLKALAELQKMYVAATTESAQEQVKVMVAKIRELSKTTRQEIRTLNQELVQFMPLQQAKQLYERLLKSQ